MSHDIADRRTYEVRCLSFSGRSVWRQGQLLIEDGLFEVVDGI